MGVPEPRNYSQEERAEAIALGLSIGGNNAADRLKMPRRTLHNWLEREAVTPTLITAESRSAVVDRLWQTLTKAAQAVESGLADPRQRLGDRARALEVLVHAHELLRGGPTERLETEATVSVVEDLRLTSEQRDQLRSALRDQLTFTATLERLQPGMAAQMDAEYRAIGEKWHRIAEGHEPLAIGPGIIEGEAIEDAPLTDLERAQLAQWARSAGIV
jgi:transposase-like protein